jgi:hypothetical protein
MMPPSEGEAHRAVPSRLLELHERANGADLDGEGIQSWLEWEWEAARWRVPAEISGDDLRTLIERGTGRIERGGHGAPPEAGRTPR